MNKFELDKSKNYLLACSFGPDSMALFHLLQSGGYKFCCAIVNYNLRKESVSEVDGLMEYASKFGVAVYLLDYKEKIVGNVESKCRDIRYNFFYSLYEDIGFDSLLVAQHEDDHIETYLLQKQRQNCPNYYGIQEFSIFKDMPVIRPLLSCSKKDLLSICKKNNVPYAIDKTNLENKFERNKIRHEIVENLSDKKRQQVLKEIDSANKELKKELNKIDETKIFEVKYFLSLNNLQQKYVLNFKAKSMSTQHPLSKENVGEIIKILKSKKPNVISKIKPDLFLLKEYDVFYLLKKPLRPIEYSFELAEPGILDTEYFYLDFSLDSSNRNVGDNDYPLTIRSIRSNDIYFINDYENTGNRLMIDWKVPLRLRRIWPVIINKNGKIIYIPRYRSDFVPDNKTNFYVKTK